MERFGNLPQVTAGSRDAALRWLDDKKRRQVARPASTELGNRVAGE